MEKNNTKEIIDVRKLLKLIYKERRLFKKTVPLAFILSCIWIFPEPRYYNAEVSLAPETVSESASGGLSAIAATFGMNLGGAQNDAIYPALYPELFDSNDFIVSLFDIDVATEDGEVKCDYYTYLKKHQKHNFLTYPFKRFWKSVTGLLKTKKNNPSGAGGEEKINSFNMSEEDNMLVEGVKKKIMCSVDKKTDVTTIIVKDQDPLVCATLADSVKERLQRFITAYRTSKARQDMVYYDELCDSAKVEYEKAVKVYSEYCDSHKDMVLQTYVSKRDELENDMSVKFNTYNAMNSQLQTAKAKVREKTPAFTTLKSATVPIKPAGPKRMIFVFGMTFLTIIGTSLWICRHDLVARE